MQSIQYILNDIKLAIENKAYLSALSLALTLPDLCGQVAYPNIKGVGSRYTKWLRNTIYNKDFEKHSGIKCWNGKDMAAIMYDLRCKFLHSGETVQNKTRTSKSEGVRASYYFELNVWKRDDDPQFPMMNGCDSFGSCDWMDGDTEVIEYEIKLNIVELCKQLSNAARVFFERNKGNPAWNDKTINIVYHEKVKTDFGSEYFKKTSFTD